MVMRCILAYYMVNYPTARAPAYTLQNWLFSGVLFLQAYKKFAQDAKFSRFLQGLPLTRDTELVVAWFHVLLGVRYFTWWFLLIGGIKLVLTSSSGFMAASVVFASIIVHKFD